MSWSIWLGGLEISCYDKLPIGERGLPFASDDTIARTNARDENSIQYVLDQIKHHKKGMEAERETTAFGIGIGFDSGTSGGL